MQKIILVNSIGVACVLVLTLLISYALRVELYVFDERTKKIHPEIHWTKIPKVFFMVFLIAFVVYWSLWHLTSNWTGGN